MGALSLILKHPGDIIPLIKVKMMADNAKKLPKEPNLAFCYDMLNKVSRSFAIVIQQLGPELRDAVCVFYLVLRALDTVEDDMAIPDEVKCPELEQFYKKIYDPTYKYPCGEKYYKILMDEYPKVTDVFLKLKKPYQDAIADITKRMGAGMSNFIKREVITIEDFDEYCHYVAGLVGIGLSSLWASSGLEDKEFANMEGLSNKMGLFLQKTNIIRDYLEDIVEEPAPRMFWPRDVWSLYAKELDQLKEPENREKAVFCMNHLITNALTHATESLGYMQKLKDPQVFQFCAIPQVMAIATLAECYDNGKVFEGVVKIRRGLSARIMLFTRDIFDAAKGFKHFAGDLASKVKPGKDPNAKETLARIEAIESACDEILKKAPIRVAAANDDEMPMGQRIALWFLFAGYFLYTWRLGPIRESLGVAPDAGSPLIDNTQRVVSTIALFFITFLVIVGKKR